ncbi:MAG TPA: D-alanine--D-alanine ligase [Dongiaceae bacterium]|jgi:D-alanine-D-alanine ligase|nr:D-alanine--D-alanine ligase [Dongiaceae bacterium]
MKRVAVLMGGPSAEREVSLVSGRECAKGLQEAGYDVYTIDVGHDVAALVNALTPRPDAAFNALHGRYGEDGCVQGVLEFLNIPYTHSGLLASALAMDKTMAKRLFAQAGIRCPEGREIEVADLDHGEAMARPYIVKPVHEGSSVGVRIVRQGDNQPPRAADWRYGPRVMVERYVPGRELTVAVMGDRPLAVTELRPRAGFYDYEAKYTDGKTEHLVPAPVPPAVYDEALRMARLAHDTLGCRGVSRADFRYDDTGKGGPDQLYLLEINTQPGMTPLSLVPEQAKHQGISFPELVGWMVENARCDG